MKLDARIKQLETMQGVAIRPDLTAVSDDELDRAMAIKERYDGLEPALAMAMMGAELVEQCPNLMTAVRKARRSHG